MFLRKPSPLAIRILAVLVVVAASVALVSAPNAASKITQKAAFADPNLVNFVRPGLVYTILSAQIAADGTVTARVKITDPKGLPLDKAGIKTPGVVGGSLILASIPKGQTQYLSYTTLPQTSPITGKTNILARADSGGVWTEVAEGEYTYKFATKLPAGYDKTATHTIGIYGNRNLTEFDMGTQLADAVYSFVPDGSKVTVVRDVIRTATCNKCHDNMHFHGETGRKSVEICVLCHQPQSVDPDTGNTVDLAVMIHKIHSGKHLPSVIAGRKYVIIGNAQSVNDFSDVGFPSDLRSCTTCHESNRGATQADAWLTRPNREACRSCHDDVNFATGDKHVDLPQVSDNQCATCHIPQGEIEFDASIKGAHTIPRESAMLGGLQYELIKVDDAAAGKKPTVTFSIKDKAGAPLALSQMQRLALVLGGPTTDYSAFTTGYVAEDISSGKGVSGANGIYTYTFTNAIPADAKGTFTIMIEGRREQKVLEGTKKEQTVRYGAPNKVIYFSVDGSKVQSRRKVVDLAKCNACHTNLTLHGENRMVTEACVICHNPIENDKSRRPATAGAPETVDFRFMIHRIHGGKQVSEEDGTEFIVYGYGGSKNDFGEVGFPAPLNSCKMCHVNDSQSLPAKGVVPVQAPRQILKTMQPTAAACLACHQSTAAASHALGNTNAIGESCAVCHGPKSDFSVNKVHTPDVQ